MLVAALTGEEYEKVHCLKPSEAFLDKSDNIIDLTSFACVQAENLCCQVRF